jgi:hypothetical protein
MINWEIKSCEAGVKEGTEYITERTKQLEVETKTRESS